MVKEKERVIWRVWGGETPSKSLVSESDHSNTVASFYPHGEHGNPKPHGSVFVRKTM